MRNELFRTIATIGSTIVFVLAVGSMAVGTQDDPRVLGFGMAESETAAKPAPLDATGMWGGVPGESTKDLVQYLRRQGQDVPFTRFGAERYKNVDLSQDPDGRCLPPGPSRAITGTSPFFLVSHREVVSLSFDDHNNSRLIYLDGRKHPEDLDQHPTFMGHSIGRWEGNTLIVDTAGINELTWLDGVGLEHSDELRLTERFEVLSAGVIRYTVTYNDPAFFTMPWSVSLTLQRITDRRMLGYVCVDNNTEKENVVPTR
jgi:hypothetical protein